MVDPGTAIVGFLGVGCLALALASLRHGSWIRRAYGTDPANDGDARANALVMGVVGASMLALAVAIDLELPERTVGTAAILGTSALCIGLGWAVRRYDRRDLLTTPNVDRETGKRLGTAAMICGVLVLPLAGAIWLEVGAGLVVLLAAGSGLVSLLAIGIAYR
ncbi:hypothetical protein [Natronosalvus halobius]|uniref:hypothetical protein n=1 Tax=Natronosalvus halobius TaxID=2953746 RepID=UPI00209E6C9D|nr:hypothetical protein [Natronosalvus halobius]USZ71192.1 hypothetical protein NGM15_14065 [Natronosalvus halobius]